MEWFGVCGRLVLAAVFAVAAVGKLRDRERSATSLAEFGVPALLADPASIGLPAVELLVAVGLLLAPTARAGAIAALALLVAFTAAVALAVRRGQQPACHCFGSLGSQPVGGPVILRNAALAVIAAGVTAQAAQPAIDGWVTQRSAEQLAILSLSAALVIAAGVAGTLWHQNRARRRPAPAPVPTRWRPVGSRAPGFRLADVNGARITLKSLLRDSSPIALVFLSPGCAPCADVLAELPRWQAPLSRDLPIHVVSSVDREQTRAMVAAHGVDRVLIDARGIVATRYGISGTPSALIIGADGRVASAPESGRAAIEAVLRRALDAPRSRDVDTKIDPRATRPAGNVIARSRG